MVLAVLQSFTSFPSKADTSLRRTVRAGPERVRLRRSWQYYILKQLFSSVSVNSGANIYIASSRLGKYPTSYLPPLWWISLNITLPTSIILTNLGKTGFLCTGRRGTSGNTSGTIILAKAPWAGSACMPVLSSMTTSGSSFLSSPFPSSWLSSLLLLSAELPLLAKQRDHEWNHLKVVHFR